MSSKSTVSRQSTFSAYAPDRWTLIPLHRPDDTIKDKRTGRVRSIGKAPLDRNWTTAKYDTRAVVKRCVREGRNVGVRLTEEQLVVDVDPRNGGEEGFDNLCFMIGMDPERFPRVITGSGGWHYYMRKPAGLAVVDSLPDFPGVEYKSKGRQVLAAGSVHPDTGRSYKFAPDSPPLSELPPAPSELLELIRRPERASAVKGGGQYSREQIAHALAALDPTDFREHDDWLRLMMACHHASNGDAREEFVEWSTSDPQYADHEDIIGRRWDSLHANHENAVTFATLNKILADAGRADLQVAPDAADDFPDDLERSDDPEPIKYDETQLPQMLDHVERAMLAASVPLYQMGGRVVHPVRLDRDSRDEDDIRRRAGALTIAEVSPLRLREYMIEHAPFYKLAKAPGTGKYIRTNFAVPLKIANHYLARGDKWRVPVLRGVIEAPTLRSDGTLLTADGYDEASGLLLDTNGVSYPAIDDRPSIDDARRALKTLLLPFKDFPFVTNAKGASASRSVMLSAVLTALVRRTLHSAPLHGFSAPTMGTGKTLACDVVSMIATGRLVTAMSQGANEEEDEKRLFSVLLTGDLILLIDNVKRPIEGDALCTILTQATWQSRLLGENRKVSVPTNSLFLASGNNLGFKGDMTTRALLCRMDAQIERPETRRFDVDLKTEVPKRRAELVAAGLTILRAFVVAGRPGLERLEPFGRFEDWSNLVRGAIVWLGEPDPCRTRAYIAVDDPERTDLGRLLQAIADNTDGPFTAGELIDLGEEASDNMLRDAIFAVAPKGDRPTLGLYLKAKQGRIVGGLMLRSNYSTRQKGWRYRVVKAA